MNKGDRIVETGADKLEGVSQKAAESAAVRIGIGMLVGAAVLALYGLGFGLAAAAAGLDTALSTWLSLLIVAVALFLVVGLLALLGIGSLKKGAPPVPEQAIDEAK